VILPVGVFGHAGRWLLAQSFSPVYGRYDPWRPPCPVRWQGSPFTEKNHSAAIGGRGGVARGSWSPFPSPGLVGPSARLSPPVPERLPVGFLSFLSGVLAGDSSFTALANESMDALRRQAVVHGLEILFSFVTGTGRHFMLVKEPIA
jgi:hypothetical protein